MPCKAPNRNEDWKGKVSQKGNVCMTKKNIDMKKRVRDKGGETFDCECCPPIFQSSPHQIKPLSCIGGSLFALHSWISKSIKYLAQASNSCNSHLEWS